MEATKKLKTPKPPTYTFFEAAKYFDTAQENVLLWVECDDNKTTWWMSDETGELVRTSESSAEAHKLIDACRLM